MIDYVAPCNLVRLIKEIKLFSELTVTGDIVYCMILIHGRMPVKCHIIQKFSELYLYS